MKFGKVYDLERKGYFEVVTDKSYVLNEVTYLMYYGGGAMTTGEFMGVELTGDVLQDIVNVAKVVGVDVDKDGWMLDLANKLYGDEIYYEAMFIVVPEELFDDYAEYKEIVEESWDIAPVRFWGGGLKTELDGRPAIVNIVTVEPSEFDQVFELGGRVVTDDGWLTGYLVKDFKLRDKEEAQKGEVKKYWKYINVDEVDRYRQRGFRIEPTRTGRFKVWIEPSRDRVVRRFQEASQRVMDVIEANLSDYDYRVMVRILEDLVNLASTASVEDFVEPYKEYRRILKQLYRQGNISWSQYSKAVNAIREAIRRKFGYLPSELRLRQARQTVEEWQEQRGEEDRIEEQREEEQPEGTFNDEVLQREYERFRNGEITASEFAENFNLKNFHEFAKFVGIDTKEQYFKGLYSRLYYRGYQRVLNKIQDDVKKVVQDYLEGRVSKEEVEKAVKSIRKMYIFAEDYEEGSVRRRAYWNILWRLDKLAYKSGTGTVYIVEDMDAFFNLIINPLEGSQMPLFMYDLRRMERYIDESRPFYEQLEGFREDIVQGNIDAYEFCKVLSRRFGRSRYQRSVEWVRRNRTGYHQDRRPFSEILAGARRQGVNDGRSRVFSIEFEHSFALWSDINAEYMRPFTKFERDGSLWLNSGDDTAVEMVWGGLAGEPGYKFLEDFFRKHKGKIIMTKKESDHIHIDARDIWDRIYNNREGKKWTRIVGSLFLHSLVREGLIPVRRRIGDGSGIEGSNHYAQIPKEESLFRAARGERVSSEVYDYLYYDDHYYAVNLTHHETIEFRVPENWELEGEKMRVIAEASVRFVEWWKSVVTDERKFRQVQETIENGVFRLEDIFDREFLERLRKTAREMRIKRRIADAVVRGNAIPDIDDEALRDVNHANIYRIGEDGRTYRYRYIKQRDGNWRVTVFNMYGDVVRTYTTDKLGK